MLWDSEIVYDLIKESQRIPKNPKESKRIQKNPKESQRIPKNPSKCLDIVTANKTNNFLDTLIEIVRRFLQDSSTAVNKTQLKIHRD